MKDTWLMKNVAILSMDYNNKASDMYQSSSFISYKVLLNKLFSQSI